MYIYQETIIYTSDAILYTLQAKLSNEMLPVTSLSMELFMFNVFSESLTSLHAIFIYTIFCGILLDSRKMSCTDQYHLNQLGF